MRYVDQVLQPGESIRWVTTVSRVGYIRGIAVLVAAFVVWGVTPTSNAIDPFGGSDRSPTAGRRWPVSDRDGLVAPVDD
jgi:hypothetical protein